MRTILVFGHEDFEYDNKALKLISYLKEQLPYDTINRAFRPEQVMDFIGKGLVILDVAKGIGKPLLITDLNSINYPKTVTAHDMDLASFLKVLQGLGQLPNIKIVAVPYDKDPNAFKEEILSLIKNVPGSSRKDS